MVKVDLEFYGARWLWNDKQCPIVINERSPRSWSCGEPDVLGVTKNRYLLEIEVKRSLSDFRANAEKRCIRNREMYLEKQAKNFWFLVPKELVEKVRPILPEWAGLLMMGEYAVQSVVPAPSNSKSKRLSPLECAKLVRLQTNQLMATQHKLMEFKSSFRWGFEPWNQDYEI